VPAARQRELNRIVHCGGVVHLIDYQDAVDVEAHAIIDGDLEPIVARFEIDRSRPAH